MLIPRNFLRKASITANALPTTYHSFSTQSSASQSTLNGKICRATQDKIKTENLPIKRSSEKLNERFGAKKRAVMK